MSDPLSCDYEEASLNHLRDALAMTPAQRWQWLRETMDFCEQMARHRATQGLVTLSASGKVLWSPEMAREWELFVASASSAGASAQL